MAVPNTSGLLITCVWNIYAINECSIGGELFVTSSNPTVPSTIITHIQQMFTQENFSCHWMTALGKSMGMAHSGGPLADHTNTVY